MMGAGFLLGPWLAVNYGWRALFYAFGVLGGAWALWWAAAVLPLPHPDKSPASYVNMALPLKQPQQQSAPTPARPAGMLGAIRQLPFGLLLSNRAVQGLCICHFIYSWVSRFLTSPAWMQVLLGVQPCCALVLLEGALGLSPCR